MIKLEVDMDWKEIELPQAYAWLIQTSGVIKLREETDVPSDKDGYTLKNNSITYYPTSKKLYILGVPTAEVKFFELEKVS